MLQILPWEQSSVKYRMGKNESSLNVATPPQREKHWLQYPQSKSFIHAYLYGSSFRLITDHNPLTSLKGLKDVGGRLTRWMLFLQQFSFQFEYKPGKSLGNVDALSRVTSIIPGCSSTIESIGEAQLQDEQLLPIVKALSDGTSLPSKVAPGLCQAFLHNGVLYRQFRQCAMSPSTAQLIVPNSMKDDVLNQLHNQAGHLGIHKTTEKIKERFYWPGYEQDIENWVRACQLCQKRNPSQPTLKLPWERLAHATLLRRFPGTLWVLCLYLRKDTSTYW